MSLKATVGVDENLGVPVDSLIELLIGSLRIINVNLMRDDEAGLGLACNDQVTQISVVSLDVALASAERKSLGLFSKAPIS